MTKTKLLWIALALSAAFNLFFIAGVVVVKHRVDQIKTAEGRVSAMTKRLGLDADQASRFTETAAEIRSDIRAAQRQKLRNTARFEALLETGDDIAALRSAYARIRQEEAEARKRVRTLWRESFQTWSPEQRAEFREITRQWPLLAKMAWIPEAEE